MTQTIFPPASIDANIVQPPESPRMERFLNDLQANLPQPYCLHDGKIQISGRQRTMIPICSPMRVTALVRDPDGQGWCRLVEVFTPDQRVTECLVPNAEIEAKPLDAIARLADRGMQVHAQRDDLITFLKSWKTNIYALRLDQTGWSRDRSAFALADGRIIAPEKKNEPFIYSGPVNRTSTGRLEDWRAGIAALAVDNPYLIFGISLAFSGPLLALTGRTGGIFHIHGGTSIGKTKILQAALSVWPRAEKEFTWRSTSAGMEGLLVEANDTFLGLDELPLDPHSGFADDIYSAANGSGKNRATVTGGAKERQQWRAPILSTGETPVSKLLRDQGQSMRGGQGVRMIDIPVAGMLHGAFDTLHGRASSAEFARDLELLAPRDCGHAGAEFVRKLIKAGPAKAVLNKAESVHKVQVERLLQHLDLEAVSAGNEILRILDRFAIVAMAGEFATGMKITGWEPQTASNAIERIAANWYEHRGTDAPADRSAAVEITRDFLQRVGDSRFAVLRKSGDQNSLEAPATRSHDAAGYRDDDYFYVFKASFDEMHRGYDLKRAAEHLQAAGYLEPGGERNSLQFRLSGLGKQRVRVYRVRADILGA